MVKSKIVSSLVVVAALAVGMAPAPAQAQANANAVVITNVDIDPADINIDGNVLRIAEGTVSGTIAGLPFTTDITNFALQLVPDDPATPAEECSVLDLELGPINLALLGLRVDTSEICLEITATEGGGLLGDLLCSLAGGGLLGDGLPVLPDATQLIDLQAGLLTVLQETLGQSLQTAAHGAESVCSGECEVLELVVGPLDLSLLGLNVSLDDCNDGPVQVCVSATASEGLLGGLLCGLAGGNLLGGLDLGLLQDLLDAILGGSNGGQALAGLNVPTKTVNQLVKEVSKLLRNGDLSPQELNRLEKRIEKIVRKN